MKQKEFLSISLLLAIGSLLIMAGRVDATPYSFSVDRFEFVGNLPGYFVDEFDDGVLAPWILSDGTAAESGGVITLSDPGFVSGPVRFKHLFLTTEVSTVFLPVFQLIADGAGDFQATSTWVPVVPAQNQFYSMHAAISTLAGADLQLIELGVTNAGPLIADALGISAGLYITFSTSVGGGIDVPTQFATIAEGDITGDILLSLFFDDIADQFTGAFSLDGGATVRSFAPFESRLGEGIFDNWEFAVGSVDAQVIPEPSTLLLLASGLAGLAGFGRKRL
jgi:hypothetical protein